MREKIRQWVVKTGSVTKPYKKEWSVSVTLNCYDYNEIGDTVEKAYQKLTDRIYESSYLLGCFTKNILSKTGN